MSAISRVIELETAIERALKFIELWNEEGLGSDTNGYIGGVSETLSTALEE